MKQRDPIEFGIILSLDRAMILQQSELISADLSYFPEDSQPHIYLICKRPRISFDPDRIEINDGVITLGIRVQRQANVENHTYSMFHNYEIKTIEWDCPYPFSFLTVKLNGQKLLRLKAAAMAQTASNYQVEDDYLDLEIVYVGQSYGREGSRTAPARILNHSTLQTIYADTSQKNPDCEVWLVLCSFSQTIATSLDGLSDSKNDFLEDQKDKLFQKLTKEGIGPSQEINLAEAALIRYFRPDYNVIYKESFPKLGHQGYLECYVLGINSISMELSTVEQLNCQFYSSHVERKFTHIFHYTLHTEQEKQSMYQFFPDFKVPGLQN
ncbi:hypothetical protein J2Y45_006749 [Dyadobacter sp. BE34]|uniref:Uncharacterized protein n=1 Tax=Dyadobacter fermentans TaxID=94254 RepID=A0ABU1R8Z5_9BACT|nr:MULTISPECIES: hypothetical protein [Dyadobacter]MDR6809672.1 hypothetical protein [Dyadobacter fermentans]MDR7047350.1 hypothetical protein [Dyadobacter sp. BE242]MDR7201585.1 hypothetical protein [Dyadobacter sp. BE34]MDR7219455.1 hypothetical protein [Dyadobacter sp. BE31]MDR7267150.1 hypothetical protein [Dyadobacter sp. BE32]